MHRYHSLTRWLALPAALMLLASQPARAAEAPELMAKRLAACGSCHGDEGRTVGDDYYPAIAAKPAGYLYAQLQNFREGRRQHRIMAGLLANLSDAYLGEIALYYAGRPHAPQPPFEGATPAQLRLGERLTKLGDSERKIPACQACHGELLTGVVPQIPGLRGLPARYLDAQVGAWKNGVRQARSPDCMGKVARALSAEEITAVSAWLASQPYPAEMKPAESLPNELPLDCGVLP